MYKRQAICSENPFIATPKAVPAAGGCSVSITTIIKIEIPTASEYAEIEYKKEGCGSKVQREPERRPTMWPPMTFLGLAVTFFGIAKTMKAEAPIDAIMTACSMLKNRRTTSTARVARKL